MIDILLATYNGERFLEAQLESLLAQDFRDWRLLARDDGSADRTTALLEAYARRSAGRITVLPSDGRNLGPAGNFAELLHYSSADYVMFCDQDDVWLPGKIGVTLTKMRELEAAFGSDRPLLVHTDFRVVDKQLRVLAESGWKFQKTDPRRSALNQLLVQNVVTGCTAMMNRALLKVALPIPAGALMHDWWLALAASAFGKIGFLQQPTMLYRQHGGNEVGAQSWSAAYCLSLTSKLAFIRQVIARQRSQARVFNECFQEQLQAREKELLKAFFAMPERGVLRRRFDILRHGILYAGTIRNIGWLVLC